MISDDHEPWYFFLRMKLIFILIFIYLVTQYLDLQGNGWVIKSTVISRKNASLRSNLVHLIVFASSTYDTMQAVRSAADAVIYLSFSNVRDNTFSERAHDQ